VVTWPPIWRAGTRSWSKGKRIGISFYTLLDREKPNPEDSRVNNPVAASASAL
jgi:hypothetical protein